MTVSPCEEGLAQRNRAGGGNRPSCQCSLEARGLAKATLEIQHDIIRAALARKAFQPSAGSTLRLAKELSLQSGQRWFAPQAAWLCSCCQAVLLCAHPARIALLRFFGRFPRLMFLSVVPVADEFSA